MSKKGKITSATSFEKTEYVEGKGKLATVGMVINVSSSDRERELIIYTQARYGGIAFTTFFSFEIDDISLLIGDEVSLNLIDDELCSMTGFSEELGEFFISGSAFVTKEKSTRLRHVQHFNQIQLKEMVGELNEYKRLIEETKG